MSSFVRRRINLRFQLAPASGTFSGGSNDTIDLTGLRCSANITKAGGVSMSELDLTVYGMSLDVMNKLTVLNQLSQYQARLNTVTVSAGDDDSGLSVCFTGIISEAWTDAHAAPDVAFRVTAHTGLVDALRPVEPTSYRGTVDVATVLAGIAGQMQPARSLENSGVSVQIADPYLSGTLRDQALTVARAAGVNMLIDDTVLAIWPVGSARGDNTTLLSPDTGMVGYPSFTQSGIQVTALYNPSLVFGQKVEVKSSLTPANGVWTIASVSHNLDAEMPDGQWFTRIDCGLLGQETPIVQ